MATTDPESSKSVFQQLLDGHVPDLNFNTDVSMTTDSILNIGAIIFVAGFLIVVTWYILKNKKASF